jgi:DNA-directed RNA polymerase subunit RPC12/RpoP
MPLHPSLIDPAIPIDARGRRIIRRAAWRRWNENPVKGISFGLLGSAPIFLTAFLPAGVVKRELSITALVLIGITFAIYLYALSLILRRFSYAPCVFRELREDGYDVCLRCGYWLRGLGEDIETCPECGSQRVPLGKRHTDRMKADTDDHEE